MTPRRTFIKRVAGLVAGLAVAGSLGFGTAHADVLENVQSSGTLRVAVPQDFPPFGSVGTDLKPRGYDIDMANLIGERLGVKVELIPVTSTNRVPYLTTGKADLVISSLGKNAEREAVIDFTNAYAPFYNGVFGPEKGELADAAALDGKTVAVTRGSVEDLELTKIAPAGATLKRFEDNNSTLSAYLSGQTDYVATGNVVAAGVSEMTDARPLATQFLVKNSPCYIGLAKGEAALQAKVNEIIASAKADGSLDAIAQRWLNAPLPADL